MRIVLIGLALLPLAASLTGCAEYFAGKAAFREGAKIVASEALETNIWYLCRASPVGPVFDRFGKSADTWDAYATLCSTTIPAAPAAAGGGPDVTMTRRDGQLVIEAPEGVP